MSEEREDRVLAVAAARKQAAGVKPSRAELRALKRVKKREEETHRWEYYASIPKAHYVQLAAKSHKVVNEHCAAFGVPAMGRMIDLGRVLKWLHQFLVTHGARLRSETDAGRVAEGGSPALERGRLARAQLSEHELAKRRQELVPAEDLVRILETLKPIRQQTAQLLEKIDAEARTLYEDSLEDERRALDSLFCAD